MAESVVDLLEAVEIHDHHDEAALRPGRLQQRLLDPVVEERPVRQVGEVVVEGLVLLVGHLGPELLDEVPVLERHAGVVGQGLEELQVLLGERAQLTEPVGGQHHAE